MPVDDGAGSFVLAVEAIPPVKQTPADAAERDRQALWRQAIAEGIGRRASAWGVIRRPARVRLDIVYERGRGRSDAANIIGGIADQLEHLGVYENDAQIASLTYEEHVSVDGIDRYRVTVAAI